MFGPPLRAPDVIIGTLFFRSASADPALQCSSMSCSFPVISVINIGSSKPPTSIVPCHSGGYVMFVVRMVCSSSGCAVGSSSTWVCYNYCMNISIRNDAISDIDYYFTTYIPLTQFIQMM